MGTATVDAGEERRLYVARVRQEYSAGLRYYFLSEVGDASEADACAQEAIGIFFEEGGCGEADARHVPARLLEIASLLCSKKLAAKSAQSANGLGLDKADALLRKIVGGIIQPVKERLAFGQLFRGAGSGDGRPGVRKMSPLGRAPLASA